MCLRPQFLKTKIIPCGKCVECKKKRMNDWFVRIFEEKRNFNKSCFLTLTYNELNLPSNHSLSKRDCQLFLKRLRYFLKDRKIKYFLSGEYGGLNGRPHYHAIVLGVDFSDRETIVKAWNQGWVEIKPVSAKNIRYVAKYCVKEMAESSNSKHRIRYEEKIEYPSGCKRKKISWINSNGEFNENNFILCSKNFGASFLTDSKIVEFYFNENLKIKIHNFEYSFPRYYIKKIRDNIDSDFNRAKVTLITKKLNKFEEEDFKRDYLLRLFSEQIYLENKEIFERKYLFEIFEPELFKIPTKLLKNYIHKYYELEKILNYHYIDEFNFSSVFSKFLLSDTDALEKTFNFLSYEEFKNDIFRRKQKEDDYFFKNHIKSQSFYKNSPFERFIQYLDDKFDKNELLTTYY